MNFAKDLHRKGELKKVAEMEELAKLIERKSKGGLTPAFLTEAYKGFDCFVIMANSPEWENHTGYVLFDEDTNMATFIRDEEE